MLSQISTLGFETKKNIGTVSHKGNSGQCTIWDQAKSNSKMVEGISYLCSRSVCRLVGQLLENEKFFCRLL